MNEIKERTSVHEFHHQQWLLPFLNASTHDGRDVRMPQVHHDLNFSCKATGPSAAEEPVPSLKKVFNAPFYFLLKIAHRITRRTVRCLYLKIDSTTNVMFLHNLPKI